MRKLRHNETIRLGLCSHYDPESWENPKASPGFLYHPYRLLPRFCLLPSAPRVRPLPCFASSLLWREWLGQRWEMVGVVRRSQLVVCGSFHHLANCIPSFLPSGITDRPSTGSISGLPESQGLAQSSVPEVASQQRWSPHKFTSKQLRKSYFLSLLVFPQSMVLKLLASRGFHKAPKPRCIRQ